MTALEKIKTWIMTYPGYSALGDFSVDYTGAAPSNGSVMPSGLVEISRKSDIVGNTTVQCQYNFTLYFIFPKAPDDDVGAQENAQWLLDFQDWVQDQSIGRKAPVFGDDPRQETIKAQNGTLYGADEEGTAIYSVQLSANFTRKYREDNPWLI